MEQDEEAHKRHPLHTPTRELPHAEKVRRQQRHIAMLSAVLLVVLASLGYAAAFDLDSAAEWIVLGGIVFTAVGVIVLVNSR